MVENAGRKVTLILTLLIVSGLSLWLMGFRLGLDLQGGTRLKYRLPFEDALAAKMITPAEYADKEALTRQMIGIIRERIDPYGVRSPEIRAEGEDRIVIELPGTGTDVAEDVEGQLARDLPAGVRTINLAGDDPETLRKFPGTGGIIQIGKEMLHYRKRQDTVLTGVDRGYSGTQKHVVDQPAGTPVRLINTDPWRNLIENVGDLAFLIRAKVTDFSAQGSDEVSEKARLATWLEGNPSADIRAFNRLPRDQGGPMERLRWNPRADDGVTPLLDRMQPLIVQANEDWRFTGDHLESVTPSQDDLGFPAVGFEMVTAKREAFTDFTKAHRNELMAIVINGEIATMPNINSTLPGGGIIMGGVGGFTSEDVNNLVTILRSGSLKIKPELEHQERVGASLGEDYVRRGLYSCLLGLAAVLTFLLTYYRRLGVFAAISLLSSLVMMLGALAFTKATLTLPGVAGIILTVGMAVDANILIFERIREEALRGRKPLQAAKDGFANAFSTIIDANLTTLITALILYKFGTGPVRGFATTLSIGIITSVFSALVITRLLVHLQLERGIDAWNMMRLVKDTKFQFMSKARLAIPASIVVIVAGLVVFGSLDDKAKLGIDFLGGATMTVRTERPQAVEDMRALVREIPGIIGESAEVKAILASGDKAKGYNQFRVTFKTDGSGLQDGSAGAEDLEDTVENEVRQVLGAVLEKGPFTVELQADSTAASGTLYFEAAHPEADIRTVLAELGLSDIQLERVTGPTAAYHFEATAAVEQSQEELIALLKSGFELKRNEAGENIERLDSEDEAFAWANPIPNIAVVGAQVVTELRDKAVFAILLSLFAAVMYIRVRFAEYSYGFAAVVALVHDVLVTLGVLGVVIWLDLVDAEISLAMVAAFLTIIGYSLNDTIVVFDRIRENLPRMKGSFSEIINVSINQTLSRTILTSATTLVTVLILFLFNFNTRNVLEGFAFALTVGVLVGTYSSMFIACPVLLWLETHRAKGEGAAESKAKGKKKKTGLEPAPATP
ncbi:MAG: protein translocase subunit SecD [Planctomycetota bacterium]|nr:MAG: protein translocase subunit SecD [Planctomycetota bacterium]